MLNIERVRKWRKARQKVCPVCNSSMFYDSITCRKCSTIKKDWSKITRDELSTPRIRTLARTLYFKTNKFECTQCGYNKHVEVCHIRPINSFPLNSFISEINSLENLVGLCPNHHWEFDNLPLA